MGRDWRDLLVRTAKGTILPEGSKLRFSNEFQNLLWVHKTGVWDMMTNSSEGVQAFLDVHGMTILDCDPVKVLSLFERELHAEQKKAKAEIEATERTSKLAAKALHHAFKILGENEADRSSVLAIAATEMKVEPSAFPTVMTSLKEFIRASDVFGEGPAVKSTYVRLMTEKGEPTGKSATNRPLQGDGTKKVRGADIVLPDHKEVKKFMQSVKALGFKDDAEFIACKKANGVDAKGFISVAKCRAWIKNRDGQTT